MSGITFSDRTADGNIAPAHNAARKSRMVCKERELSHNVHARNDFQKFHLHAAPGFLRLRSTSGMTDAVPSSESIQDTVSDVLTSITGVAETQTAPDLKIRELGILDSLGIISLILALSEKFGVDIAPAEIEEEDVASPRAIAEFVQKKLKAKAR